jgi:hypothetical protein
MKALVLSPALCTALDLQATIFGQTWNGLVVGQLLPLASAKTPATGTAFSNKFDVLLRQATQFDPRLFQCFRITPYQIRHKSKDGRYLVTIQQSEKTDGVMMIWQFTSRKAGMNSVSFLVTAAGFVPQAELVSPQCQENLSLLAEAGGELLGHLVNRNLLPQGSICARAIEERIAAMTAMRTEMRRPVASA